jgi:hypothetical protein
MVSIHCKNNRWFGTSNNTSEELCKEWLSYSLIIDGDPIFRSQRLTEIEASGKKCKLTKREKDRIIQYGEQCGREPGHLINQVKVTRDGMDNIRYEGKCDNGKIVKLSYHWLEINIRHVSEKWFQSKIIDKNKKTLNRWHNIPVGSSIHSYETLALSVVQHPIKWLQQENESSCYLGNIANCLYYLGDEKASTVLNTKTKEWLLSKVEIEDKHVKQMLMNMKYQCENIPGILTEFSGASVWPVCGRITGSHRVVVWKDWIFDASHNYLLPLTTAWLNWCCGDDNMFGGLHESFRFFPAKSIRKHLNSRL